MAGVLLNAGAQLLLKAGTNVLGVADAHPRELADTLAKMATQSYFVLGAACYGASLRRLDSRALASARVDGLSRSSRWVTSSMPSPAHYLFGGSRELDALARDRISSSSGVWLVREELSAAGSPMSAKTLPQVRRPRPRRERQSRGWATCCAPAGSRAVPGCGQFRGRALELFAAAAR